jgi:hypothetical protein
VTITVRKPRRQLRELITPRTPISCPDYCPAGGFGLTWRRVHGRIVADERSFTGVQKLALIPGLFCDMDDVRRREFPTPETTFFYDSDVSHENDLPFSAFSLMTAANRNCFSRDPAHNPLHSVFRHQPPNARINRARDQRH